MLTETEKQIRIDLDQFKLHLNIEHKIQLSLHFDTPSRRFYLSVIAFVVRQMSENQGVKAISLNAHHGLIALLNETVGALAGASKKEKLIPRVYKKWKSDLPDLENAPLFRIIGRKKEYGSGIEKVYVCNEAEKDSWANLFEYKGSRENVRLRFSLDALGVSLQHCTVTYKEYTDEEAWEKFVTDLKKERESKATIESATNTPEKAVGPRESQGITWRRFALSATIVLIVCAVGLVSWNYYHGRSKRVEPASVDRMAYPLPEKPSIAVLPFKNLSDDPEQEYFSDGITEEIITALSKIPKLFVIARNSTFTYKGKPVKVQQVSEELGVRYVLEGSVRKSNDQIRITAQLIDALTGHHLWAERYDRKLEDIFVIQDEITMKIITELQIELTAGESIRGADEMTKNLDAYLKVLQSNEHFILITPDNNIRSRQLAQEAIDLDPKYIAAWAMLGYSHLMDVYVGWSKSPKESLEKAIEITQKIEKMGDRQNTPVLRAFIYWLTRQNDKAIREMENAITLDPNNDFYHQFLGDILVISGRPQDALPLIHKAMRLNPFYPTFYLCNLGRAYQYTNRYDEAIEVYETVLKRGDRDGCAHLGLAAIYIYIGRREQAENHAQQFLEIYPTFNLDWYKKQSFIKDRATLERTTDALREAGMN